ncbi:RsmB/NOP family class I SAM-dependent RNA methyltransferase [Parasphingorhabdus halotolerans]|uniref:RsmB/NOP family class I SAM-dependent RNA methyltransferase n=1 Tax=Parasphingorhabdus halotolerans TaxID=2725558 RepID=A0A6H2DPU5_9SPHN|nr:RsmB/NOP family class I SAM-dependent RNA methyltransferase [Parasphingorhabdus halotolerans]QJB69985.1 RsmB/NOP family class I SAM-dependent RNA methyltransferase [Parasphingorhabdus halotolerans]
MNEPNAKIPGLAARQSAIRLLDAVCRRGETLDQAMPAATGKLSNPSDKSLAHNIAANVLRWMSALDAMIDSATRNRLADDAKPRMALRIALVQVLILETPQHAAISTALPLVHGGPRRLVHGVFSTVMRGIESGKLKLPEYPAIPEETENRWMQNWGPDIGDAASQAWSKPALLDLSFRDENVGEFIQQFEGESLAPKHLRMLPSVPLTQLPGFDEGAFWVQDLAASIPARLLGEGNVDGGAKTVLDFCAAPGGKTMQLASNGWKVISVDNNAKRMERFHDNLSRTKLEAETVIADLMKWKPSEPADAVLFDAPCSATGIFRRHPDVLHCIGSRQIADRAEVQRALLERVAPCVKPGGVLVYAVCSLEPEEGEEQIEGLLEKRDDFEIEKVTSGELPDGIEPQADGTVRTLPNMLAEQGYLDGFYIARLRRKS